MSKKITEKIAKNRFANRSDIELVEFLGWTKKSKFYDKVINEYFWSCPDNVFYQKSSHPKRKLEKSISTRKTNGKSVDVNEAKNRLANRKDISLIAETYKSWSKKAKFYDNIIGKYFWSRPDNVFYQNSAHPERNKNVKITENEAFDRFKNRKDIKLIDFNGWNKKCVFFDNVINETFTAIPNNVFKRKSAHPKRTGKVKIDKEEAMQRFKDRDDIKLVDYKGWTKKSKFYDNIAKDFWWIKPITLFRNKSSHPSLKREKLRQARIKNKTTISYDEAVRRLADRKDISIKKEDYKGWTKKSKFYDKEIGEFWWVKPEKVYYENNSHPKKATLKTAKYVIENTNTSVNSWLKEQQDPKPAYSSLQQYLLKKNISNPSLNFLEEFISNHKSNKTLLEVAVENLFGIKHYNKSPKEISSNRRPDFKLNDKLYLNADGLYWHSDAAKENKWYHFNLRKSFEDEGLRLFQFREDEIKTKPQIIKSIVDNALGKTEERIYGRNCIVKETKHSNAEEFLIQNHLMGSVKAKHLGLYYKNDLVSLLSYKQKKAGICKIERFCSKVGASVIGGFSKLLSYLEKNCLNENIKEIHNWVDLRYGTGQHLSNKGFTLEKETLGWKWTNFYDTFNRLHCRANMDDRKLSMQEHANELGLVKIYDAGQRLWIKKI